MPPSQLHRYGGLGSINLTAVLEPLHFLLPQRETPELDVATGELSGLAIETPLAETETEPKLPVEAGPLDPVPSQSGVRDSEETERRKDGQEEETACEEDFSLE